MNSFKYSRAYTVLIMAEQRRSKWMVKEILRMISETSYLEFKKRAALARDLKAEEEALSRITEEVEILSESGFLPKRTLSVEMILNL